MKIIPAIVLIVLLTIFLAVGVSSEGEHNIFLPIVLQQGTMVPEVTIYDFDGNITTWDWLVETFGPIEWKRNGNTNVTAFKAIRGPVSLVFCTSDLEGNPIEGIPVVRYWPDAPDLPPEFYGCGKTQGIIEYTNFEGCVGFVMGGGDYYWPPDIGASCAWVPISGGSDCVCGYGMIGATNHDHIDTDFMVR